LTRGPDSLFLCICIGRRFFCFHNDFVSYVFGFC
jgi:hypothetical protein